jgi:TolA-binding protein
MKTLWTIAALASSVTLGNAQQAPRRDPPTPAPSSPRSAPAPRGVVEPMLAPSGQHLLPGVPEFPLLDMPGVPLMALDVTPLPPLPSLAPMVALQAEPLLDFPPLAMPAQAMLPMEPLLPLTPPSPLSAMTALPAQAPLAPIASLWEPTQGQGGVTPRPAVDRAREAEMRRLENELDRAEAARQRAINAQDRALLREVEQSIRQAEMVQRQVEREFEQHIRQAERAVQVDLAHTVDAIRSLNWSHIDSRVTVPAPWASQDVADSAYRAARELFNRGEYGQAVQAFRALPTRYPNSAYAADAAYYQAFSLYRIGGTTELREALTALEGQRTKYPNARSRAEAAALSTRILGVLAQRGDAQAQAELSRRASDQSGTASCDREEQAVQAEAMNALSRSDAGNVNDLITRVLARRDECSIPLRRTAVFLVGNRRDAQAVSVLSGVARNDPSVDVRVEAIGVIARLATEDGVPVLEELTRSDDERVQRSAVRALVRHPSARARTSVRALVERDDVSERIRSEALSAFNTEQATADDVAWLRALFGKVTTNALKTRTLAAIVRVGGPDVDQWLATLARDDNQPSEIRSTAMRRIGESMSVTDLGRLYDGATQQRFRNEIINVLGKRKEDAATDKLIDIAKNGTDPSLRTAAIRAISQKNDARSRQLLLEIINK